MMRRNQPCKVTRESVFQEEMSDAEDPKAVMNLTFFLETNMALVAGM